jgi:hypothetical protein
MEVSRIQLALSNTGRATLEIGAVPIQMDLAEAVFLEVFLAFGSGQSDIPGSLPYFWDWLKRYSWKSSLLLVQCVPVNYGDPLWRPPHRLLWAPRSARYKDGIPFLLLCIAYRAAMSGGKSQFCQFAAQFG